MKNAASQLLGGGVSERKVCFLTTCKGLWEKHTPPNDPQAVFLYGPLPNDMRAAVPEAGLLPNDPRAVFLSEIAAVS